MDGAITELGYARSAELVAQAERAAKRLAEKLALDVVAFDQAGSSFYLRRIHGLPARQHDWPEWLWERWCEDSTLDEHVLLSLRETFCAEAALRLDDAGFDCR